MIRFYNIAGNILKIYGSDDELNIKPGILTPFEVEGEYCDHTIYFQLVDELSKPEGVFVFSDSAKQVFVTADAQIRYIGSVKQNLVGAYIRICRCGNISTVQVLKNAVPEGITAKVILNAIEAEHHIVQRGGFILHASYINHNGKAILFTAPSGTGKSTQASLWEQLRGAEIINGDKAVVRKVDGEFVACGIPYAGSSQISKNVQLSVTAIVYLRQAAATRMERLSGTKAFRCIWEGCSVNIWDSEDVKRCSHTVMELVSQIPIYELACTPDVIAVETLETVLLSGGKN